MYQRNTLLNCKKNKNIVFFNIAKRDKNTVLSDVAYAVLHDDFALSHIILKKVGFLKMKCGKAAEV